MDLSKELIEKAKVCQTAEELIALAKENEIELSVEEAALYLQDFAEGELTDEELDNVAGGQEGCKKRNAYEKVTFQSKAQVEYIFNIGNIVQEFAYGVGSRTCTVQIIGRQPEYGCKKWWDEYQTKVISGIGAPEWADRSMFEK